MRRRGSPRVARQRQVEAAPEQLHRALLADEARLERREHAVGLTEALPQELSVDWVIGGMPIVRRKRGRVRNFGGHGSNRGLDSQPRQAAHEVAVEMRYRHRLQWHLEAVA